MATILPTKSIYYNDVNLIAQPSVVSSREEVSKELDRIIVSPMEAVIGEVFAKEADKLGLTICLHRFCPVETQMKIFTKLTDQDNVFVSVGLNDLDRVNSLAKVGARNFLIDIANGYIPNLRLAVHQIQNKTNLLKIMVGNVMTGSGYYNAACSCINTYVRCGVGGGVACGTNDSTGFNRGQITELMEIKALKDNLGICYDSKGSYTNYIVADGGIKNAGYAAKAFGAGADYCMMGRYFAAAEEAQTNIDGDGTYWGGASYKQQERFGGIKRHSEGKVVDIKDQIKPLKVLVNELWGGLSSAVSYSGYKSLTDFIGNGVFEIKENSLDPRR